jgi:RND family efflux transporter MFP subunit
MILCSCHSGENVAEKTTEAKQTTTSEAVVEMFPVQKGRLSSSLQIPGELIAYQQVDLYAKEASFVKKLYADVGSEVSAGQLLGTLEAPELGSQLAGAQSNIKTREAIYLASKANYDRLFETSKTPGTISPNDLEQATARKNADLAQWQAAKAAYRQVAEMQSYLQIRAPFSGVITARNVNTGAYVGPSGKGSEMP